MKNIKYFALAILFAVLAVPPVFAGYSIDGRSTITSGDSLWNKQVLTMTASLNGTSITFTVSKIDDGCFTSSGKMYLKVGAYQDFGHNRGSDNITANVTCSPLSFTHDLDDYPADTYPKEFYFRYVTTSDGNPDGGWAWVGPIWVSYEPDPIIVEPPPVEPPPGDVVEPPVEPPPVEPPPGDVIEPPVEPPPGDVVEPPVEPPPVIETFTLDVTISGNGKMISSSHPDINCDNSCPYSYDENTTVTLEADADDNSTFKGWSGTSSSFCNNDVNICLIPMTMVRDITANFESVAFKVWIDKDGSGEYNAGEEISGKSVWQWTTGGNVPIIGQNEPTGETDSDGIIRNNSDTVIRLEDVNDQDKFYVEKEYYEMENPKAKDSNFGNSNVKNDDGDENTEEKCDGPKNPYVEVNCNRYSFVMASDIMDGNGDYHDFPGNGKTLQDIKPSKDGYILIELVHPKVEWNLVVTFEEPHTQTFYDQVQNGLISYADYMYNYTDGYFVVKNVVLVKGAYGNSEQWLFSDIRITSKADQRANSIGNIKKAQAVMLDDEGNRITVQTRFLMGRTHYGDKPNTDSWAYTVGHESGHYLIGFCDEYMNGSGHSSGNWVHRVNNPAQFPKNYGVMQWQNSSHELSDNTDYFHGFEEIDDENDEEDGKYVKDEVTNHLYYINTSTWNHLESTFQKEIKRQLKKKVAFLDDKFIKSLIIPPNAIDDVKDDSYGDASDIFMYPCDGELVCKDKRPGPLAMNHNAVNFIEWQKPGIVKPDMFSATVEVVDSTGAPFYQTISANNGFLTAYVNARIYLDGIDEGNTVFSTKRNSLVIDSFLRDKATGPEADRQTLRVDIDIRASGEDFTIPNIDNSLSIGTVEDGGIYQITIPVDLANLDISGKTPRPKTRKSTRLTTNSFVLGATPTSQNGQIQVWLKGNTDKKGNIGIINPNLTLSQGSYSVDVPMTATEDKYLGMGEYQYESGIFLLELDSTAGTIHTINPFVVYHTDLLPASGLYLDSLELGYSSSSFEGSGNIIITNSNVPTPTISGLVRSSEIWSIGVSDSITSVHNVNFNVLFNGDLEALDASQINLYGLNNVNDGWQLIPGGFTDLRSFNAYLESLDYSSYALFAPPSDDIEPPTVVTGLQANTGDSRWRVDLQWTAPSDNRAVFAYDIRFNTVPITETNWDNSTSISPASIPAPATPGAVQSVIIEMPDPATDYYFAIRAADAASNWSALASLDAPIKSHTSDYDGDGLSDLWEMNYFGDLSRNGMDDYDGDKFSDVEEYWFGTDPTISESDSDEITEYTVTGQILDDSGNPIAGVTVQVGNKTVTTDENGRYEITGLTEGQYILTASLDGYQFEPITIVIEGNNSEITLPNLAGISLFEPRIIIAKETGHNKIVITDSEGEVINWFSTFTSGNDINVATGDFDDDGEDEIAVNVSKQVLLYKMDSEGENTLLFLIDQEGDIATGDIDGDGLPEFFTTSKAANTNSVSIYAYDGTLLKTVNIDSLGKNTKLSIATADTNGDGTVEIIAGDLKGDQVAIYNVDGTEINTFTVFQDTNTRRRAVRKPGDNGKACDENGKGDPKFCNEPEPPPVAEPTPPTEPEPVVIEPPSNPEPAVTQPVPVVTQPTPANKPAKPKPNKPAKPSKPKKNNGVKVAAGDTNGDGIPEIIVGMASKGSTVEIYNIDGERQQVFATVLNNNGIEIAAGDVNKDGKDDVIVGDAKGTKVLVFDLDGQIGQFQGLDSKNIASIAFGKGAVEIVNPFPPEQPPVVNDPTVEIPTDEQSTATPTDGQPTDTPTDVPAIPTDGQPTDTPTDVPATPTDGQATVSTDGSENSTVTDDVTTTDEEPPVIVEDEPKDEPIGLPALPPPPTTGDISGTRNYGGETLTDATIEAGANIAKVNIAGETTNEGRLSNITVSDGATLQGGIISGDLANEGIVKDITFVGRKLEGGEFGGTLNIESNAEIGLGTVGDVTLLADTQVKGGIFEGTVAGDADSKALIEAAKFDSEAKLANVIIGQDCEIEEGVEIGTGVRFTDNGSIPEETDLSAALTTDGEIDFSTDVVTDAPSLLTQINALPDMQDNDWQLEQNDGRLEVMVDGTRMRVKPKRVKQAKRNRRAEIIIHGDGTVTVITAKGREILVEVQVVE